MKKSCFCWEYCIGIQPASGSGTVLLYFVENDIAFYFSFDLAFFKGFQFY